MMKTLSDFDEKYSKRSPGSVKVYALFLKGHKIVKSWNAEKINRELPQEFDNIRMTIRVVTFFDRKTYKMRDILNGMDGPPEWAQEREYFSDRTKNPEIALSFLKKYKEKLEGSFNLI